MNTYNFILASASPRRKELLSTYITEFSIMPANIDETIPLDAKIEEVPLIIAKNKANAVRKYILDNQILIAADTIVVLDNKIYGKPKNKQDASEMLKNFSNKEHKVITGVYCCNKDNSLCIEFTDTTRVTFSQLTNSMINDYLNENEFIDKAGGYAIQGKAAHFVTKIDGSYDNVVGLPLGKLIRNLLKNNINIFQK